MKYTQRGEKGEGKQRIGGKGKERIRGKFREKERGPGGWGGGLV